MGQSFTASNRSDDLSKLRYHAKQIARGASKFWGLNNNAKSPWLEPNGNQMLTVRHRLNCPATHNTWPIRFHSPTNASYCNSTREVYNLAHSHKAARKKNYTRKNRQAVTSCASPKPRMRCSFRAAYARPAPEQPLAPRVFPQMSLRAYRKNSHEKYDNVNTHVHFPAHTTCRLAVAAASTFHRLVLDSRVSSKSSAA